MLTDLSITTIIAIAALAIGALSILFLMWRNAQSSGSLMQMLHRTEKVPYHGEIDPRRFSDRDRD